jgi:DNA (cytosine-5)-methyltransferase 1
MKKFSIGEFYCGPGGLGLGAKLAKIKDGNNKDISFRHIFATDHDQDTCDIFKKNIRLNPIYT